MARTIFQQPVQANRRVSSDTLSFALLITVIDFDQRCCNPLPINIVITDGTIALLSLMLTVLMLMKVLLAAHKRYGGSVTALTVLPRIF
ncbi:hypothetical protein O9929_20600 [Vibrio lentus]|nr:hypothetical protein [Vibrio lentus]